jgi:hypothetical protein
MPLYWRRKLSRLEAGLFAGLCAVLIAVFIERALAVMEFAERTAMEVTVQHVNSALVLRRAAQLLEGGAPEPAKALQSNPFEFARVRVWNIHPDVADAKTLPELERRYWVFDRSDRELVYLARLHRGLRTDGADGMVRFRLVETRGNGYRLVPVEKYSWD